MKGGRGSEGEEAANSVARQAGVEEGIWNELWSRSLSVRLTQQQPCHGPNPPNQPSTTGAETSKDWRGGLRRGEEVRNEGRMKHGKKWREKIKDGGTRAGRSERRNGKTTEGQFG